MVTEDFAPVPCSRLNYYCNICRPAGNRYNTVEANVPSKTGVDLHMSLLLRGASSAPQDKMHLLSYPVARRPGRPAGKSELGPPGGPADRPESRMPERPDRPAGKSEFGTPDDIHLLGWKTPGPSRPLLCKADMYAHYIT